MREQCKAVLLDEEWKTDCGRSERDRVQGCESKGTRLLSSRQMQTWSRVGQLEDVLAMIVLAERSAQFPRARPEQ